MSTFVKAIESVVDEVITSAKEMTGQEHQKKKQQEVASANIKKGNVCQRNYVLNDSNALKKKVKNEKRTEPFNLGTEARNGANMVVQMKTSFFEHFKSNFINDIVKKGDIENVENALGTKVNAGTLERHLLNTPWIFHSDMMVKYLSQS